jgi:NAD/NADP transhydrogenase alpha subunit
MDIQPMNIEAITASDVVVGYRVMGVVGGSEIAIAEVLSESVQDGVLRPTLKDALRIATAISSALCVKAPPYERGAGYEQMMGDSAAYQEHLSMKFWSRGEMGG